MLTPAALIMTKPSLHPAAFIPLHCGIAEVEIRVEPADIPLPTSTMLERWQQAASANPRLFNGPILRYMSHEAGRGARIVARHDTYQRYGMQRHVAATADPARDVYHLAVTGVVTARDAQGHDAILLGKRGGATFIYPHMWEHAPGGGLESTDIYDQLLREMEEELGLSGLVDGSTRDEILEPPAGDDVLGLAIDPNAPSLDVVIRLRLREGAERRITDASWEYGATRFVPTDALPAFLREHTEPEVIPPAVAVWRGMGWI